MLMLWARHHPPNSAVCHVLCQLGCCLSRLGGPDDVVQFSSCRTLHTTSYNRHLLHRATIPRPPPPARKTN
jgi:hypothetical protein